MKKARQQWTAVVALAALFAGQIGGPLVYAEQKKREEDKQPSTVTPIKHVIVLIGENRTFDNVYGTYVPKHHQSVSNLLAKRIVNADGSPGPNKDAAKQFNIGTINPALYFISTNKLINPNKTAYAPFLPTPEAGGAPPQTETRSQFQNDPVASAIPSSMKPRLWEIQHNVRHTSRTWPISSMTSITVTCPPFPM